MMAHDHMKAAFSEARLRLDEAEAHFNQGDHERAYRHLQEAEYVQYRLRDDLLGRVQSRPEPRINGGRR